MDNYHPYLLNLWNLEMYANFKKKSIFRKFKTIIHYSTFHPTYLLYIYISYNIIACSLNQQSQTFMAWRGGGRVELAHCSCKSSYMCVHVCPSPPLVQVELRTSAPAYPLCKSSCTCTYALASCSHGLVVGRGLGVGDFCFR